MKGLYRLGSIILFVALAIAPIATAAPMYVEFYNDGTLALTDRNATGTAIKCEIILQKDGLESIDRYGRRAAEELLSRYPVASLATIVSDAIAQLFGKPGVTREIVLNAFEWKIKKIWKKCKNGDYGEVEKMVLITVKKEGGWTYSVF